MRKYTIDELDDEACGNACIEIINITNDYLLGDLNSFHLSKKNAGNAWDFAYKLRIKFDKDGNIIENDSEVNEDE
jgi:hypothetical protein